MAQILEEGVAQTSQEESKGMEVLEVVFWQARSIFLSIVEPMLGSVENRLCSLLCTRVARARRIPAKLCGVVFRMGIVAEHVETGLMSMETVYSKGCFVGWSGAGLCTRGGDLARQEPGRTWRVFVTTDRVPLSFPLKLSFIFFHSDARCGQKLGIWV